MNRPIIKGTPLHKESIVAQTRTQADGTLIAASNAMGRSWIPAAIDYSNSIEKIKIPKKTEEKKGRVNKKDVENPTLNSTVEVTPDKPEATLQGTTDQAVAGGGEETSAGEGYEYVAPESTVKVMDPPTPKTAGQYITQEDIRKANAEARAQYDERRKAGDVSKSGKIWDGKQWVEKEIWKDILEKSKSPLETRDDRVYRKALENGPVRRNMIKSGYKPQ